MPTLLTGTCYLWVKSNPPLLYTELLNRIIRQAEKRQVTKLALKRQEGMRALFNPHSALQLLRHVLVTKTRQFSDTTNRNSLTAATLN